MGKAGTVVVDVEVNASKIASDIDKAARSAGRSLAGGLGRSARTVLGDLTSTAGAAAKGVLAIGGAATVVSARFNKGMSGVKAVAGATATELERLREAALDAGAATSFTATEAAQAEAELAKAGVSVTDILGGALIGSLDLAAAGQLDLADAATISAQAMNIFGLEGEDVGHIADVLAAGANKSAADVGQLGDALRQGGLVASQYGIDLEGTVGILAAFADNALIGSDAGTSLKTMLQRLSPISKESAKLMGEIGFSAYDAQGNFIGLAGVADELQTSLAGMTQEQRDTTLAQLFGSDAVRGATVLYELGAEGVREYTAAVDDSGAAQRMAADQLDNLSGDIEKFLGAGETALIRLGDLGQGAARELVQGATEIVDAFNEFADSPSWDRIEARLELFLDSGDLGAGVADRIADAFDRIDPADIDKAFDRLDQGRETLTGIRDDLGGLTGVTAGIAGSFVSMGLRSIPVLGQFAPAISPITGILGGLLLGTEAGRDGLEELGDSMLDVAKDAGPRVLDSLGEVADELGEGLGQTLEILSPAIADAATHLLPLFADALADVAPAAADFLVAGAELTAEVLPELVTLLEAGAPVLGVLTPALELGADAMGLLADNADILVPLLAGLGAVKLAGFVRDLGLMAKLAGPLNTLAQPLANLQGTLAGTENLRRTSQMGIALGQVGSSLRGMVTPGFAASIALGAITAAVATLFSEIEEGKRQAADWVEMFTGDFDPDLASYEALVNEYNRLSGAAGDWQEAHLNAVNPILKRSAGKARDELLEQRQPYQDLLIKANQLAEQMGITREEALTLVRAQERLGAEFGTNAGLADTFRQELDKLTGGKLSALDASIAYEQSVDNLSAALELNGNNFSTAEQAGRDNLNAVRDNAVAAHELAAAMVEEDGDVMGATASLQEHAAGLRRTLEEAGLTEEQIDDLLETYGLMPEQIETAVGVVGDQAAAAKITALKATIETLPEMRKTRYEAMIDRGQYEAVAAELRRLANPRAVQFVPSMPNNPHGGHYGPQADGSVLDFYGAGGIRENHVAQIAPAGSWRVWAEPETGGEAYIPLARSKRERSLDIWAETGARLGVVDSSGGVVVQMAAGAIVVHPLPGQDPVEIAEEVYRQFAERARSDRGFLTKIGAAA